MMPSAVEIDVVFVRQSDPETRLLGSWNSPRYAAAEPIAKRRTPSVHGSPFITMVTIVLFNLINFCLLSKTNIRFVFNKKYNRKEYFFDCFIYRRD